MFFVTVLNSDPKHCKNEKTHSFCFKRSIIETMPDLMCGEARRFSRTLFRLHSFTTALGSRARIFKRLSSPGIDSKE
jgi:hypothetical protein